MKKLYEYLRVGIDVLGPELQAKLLNKYAADGWELVNASVWWAYFKRVTDVAEIKKEHGDTKEMKKL